MKIYLSGPLSGCTDEEIYGWRTQVQGALSPLGYEFTNATLRIWDKVHSRQSYEYIVESDKTEIDQCDILLVNYSKLTCGVAQEEIYAWERSKIVLLVYLGAPQNPWMNYHCDKSFNSLDEAIRLLQFAAQNHFDKAQLKYFIQREL